MGKIKVILSILLLEIASLAFGTKANAQLEQGVFRTIVGEIINPDPDPGPDTGTDGLAPGEFQVPFRCNLNYWSWTYPGHSLWSVDVNRGGGSDDLGDDVLASADGEVVYKSPPDGGIGIRHEKNYYTYYGHMINIRVGNGDRVNAGQKIGEIGNVGNSSGPHLHINHYKGSFNDSGRIKVCYKRYGCNPASVLSNTRYRYGTDYNKGCS